MFCLKCGTNLPENSEFCSNCGANLKELKLEILQSNQNNNIESLNIDQLSSISPTSGETMTDMLSKKSKDFLSPIISKIKSFVSKYRKQLLISIVFLVVIFILIFICGKLFGFERLKWDKDYEDYKLHYVTQSKIKLGVKFSDEKKSDQLKIKTTCGNTEIIGLELNWDLTKSLGECRIEVSYKMKKISKMITVINPFAEKHELSLDYKIDYDSDEDLDLDGLSNKQEKEYYMKLFCFHLLFHHL